MSDFFKPFDEATKKPDWMAELEADFKKASKGVQMDIAAVQKAMDVTVPVYKEGPKEGLKRFLHPVPGKVYCGLDREGWKNKIERLTPDIL